MKFFSRDQKIDENGWHQIIVDELFVMAVAENYKIEFEQELKEVGPQFVQLKNACSKPKTERYQLVTLWQEQLTERIAKSFIRFLQAKPQYGEIILDLQKKFQCFSATQWFGRKKKLRKKHEWRQNN